MARSTFDFKGLNLGTGDKNITYLYGLSDFWAIMFEGNDKINLLLEANSQSCSDIYSKFLQLSSTLSLEQIQTDMGYQTKLVLINDSAFVQGSVNTYNLPSIIVSARFLADRPLLPNLLLEKDVHFSLINDGSQIQFSAPLSTLGFPIRANSDGSKDYAIWFTDAQVDEFTIYNYYGKLIDLTPHTSTENFRNFVQGLYYLFVNGPTVDWIKKGLNLALGIPLARATETVLDIRKYLDTQQFLVTTDTNSYLIPFGLSPTVAVDEVLVLGDTLAEWIEVKDWKEDNSWWINLYIPSQLIPYIPSGQVDRHALPGSYSDYLMANYLKYHSFLVNVQVVDHTNLEFLTQIPSLLSRAKPAYTYPVYIWSVPIDEIINIEETFQYRLDQFKCENLSVPITNMTRSIVFGNMYQNYDYTHLAVTNNGLTVTRDNTNNFWCNAKTDFGKSSGKWYWEITINSGNSSVIVGLGNELAPVNAFIGSDANSWGYSNNDGITSTKAFNTTILASIMAPTGSFLSPQGTWSFGGTIFVGGNALLLNGAQFAGGEGTNLYLLSTGLTYALNARNVWYQFTLSGWIELGSSPLPQGPGEIAYGIPYQNGDVIGVAADLDNKTLTFYVNGVSQGQAFSGLTGKKFYPMIGMNVAAGSVTCNFGQSDFVYPIPDQFSTGFYDKVSLLRSCPQFIRSNVSNSVQQLVGGSSNFNGLSTNLDGGILTGFLNVENQYRANTNAELAWLRAIFTRKTSEPPSKRGKITLNRRGLTAGSFPIYSLSSVGTKAKVLFNPYASWATTSPELVINGNSISHNKHVYSWGTAVSTVGISTDKWYWENVLTSLPFPSRFTIGVGDQTLAGGNSWMGLSAGAWGIDIDRRQTLVFNGINDSITIPTQSSFNIFGNPAQSFAIELRFATTTLPLGGNVYDLFNKHDGSGPFNTNGIGIEIRIQNNFLEAVRGDGTVAGTRVAMSAGALLANTMYHAIFSYDGSTKKMYLYLNGIAAPNNGVITNAIGSFTDNFPILLADGKDAKFPGTLGDVRIFPRFILDTEAAERFNYFNKNEFGVVGYWPVNEGTGTTIKDLSGYGANGSSNGAPVWTPSISTNIIHNGVKTSVGVPLFEGDVIGMVYLKSTNVLSIYKNGVFIYGIAVTGLLYPMISINTANTIITGNLGSSTFGYAPSLGAVPGIYDAAKSYQYAVGQSITINGATGSAYNGNFTITEAGPNTFNYIMPNTVTSPDPSITSTIQSSEGSPTTAFDQTGGSGVIYPLYITTQADIVNKFTTIGIPIPQLSDWVFTIFQSSNTDGPINSYTIDGNIATNFFTSLQGYYSLLFFRQVGINYLGAFMPPGAIDYTYAPLIGDLQNLDYLLFIRIQENAVGVYWVTSNANPTNPAPVYFGIKQTDPVTITLTAALSRGLGPMGSPYYTLRGDSYTMSYNNNRQINEVTTDDTETLSSLVQATYTDALNPNIPILRNGTRIAIIKELS